MTEQNTLDKITSWASDKYNSTAPSLAGPSAPKAATAPAPDTGLLSAATNATSTAVNAPAGPAIPSTTGGTTSNTPKANVSDWYRSALGRDGDAGGISFWQNALNTGADAGGVYQDFLKSAGTNHEAVRNGTTLEQANHYTGPQSTNGTTNVDEWGTNVLGRALTTDEASTWSKKLGAAKSPQQAQQVYADFLAANAGSVKRKLDLATASQISPSAMTTAANGATLINPNMLATRTVDPKTETVNGQLGTIMAADSPLLQQARADGMRTAFDRGLGNSSIAASAGEDSLLRAALQVATPDAATYGRASDYNTAAENQATMFNAEQSNQFALADKQQTQQMTIAQMQDTTQRWQAEKQDATSRYNTDAQYKQQVDNQKLGVANNIIANMELSPDRKAAMLEELGFGTMARDGTPGTGLAGAVYVIDSTSYDMTGDTFHDMAQIAAKNVNGGKPTDAEKEAWATGHTTAGTNYPTGPVMPPAPADYQPPG